MSDLFFDSMMRGRYPRLATTAYVLGRLHTCEKCEHSNIPCNGGHSVAIKSQETGVDSRGPLVTVPYETIELRLISHLLKGAESDS